MESKSWLAVAQAKTHLAHNICWGFSLPHLMLCIPANPNLQSCHYLFLVATISGSCFGRCFFWEGNIKPGSTRWFIESSLQVYFSPGKERDISLSPCRLLCNNLLHTSGGWHREGDTLWFSRRCPVADQTLLTCWGSCRRGPSLGAPRLSKSKLQFAQPGLGILFSSASLWQSKA